MGDRANSRSFACNPHKRLDFYRHASYGNLLGEHTGTCARMFQALNIE